MIKFKFDKLAAQKIRAAMFNSAKEVERATAAAISDTTKNLRTIASNEIRQHLNLKKKAVDRRIHRFFLSKLAGGIRLYPNRPISLSNLTRKARQTKKGVEYQLYKGKKTFVPSAFGPKITKLHGSVYVRAGKARKPLNIKRYVDLATDLKSIAIMVRLRKEAAALMQKNLKRRINLIQLRKEGKIKTPARKAA